VISYLDDLTITVGSDFVRSNIHPLQYYFGIFQRQGADLGVAFSVPKTELIHWRTLKDRADASFAPIVINDMVFPPSQVVRRLGYWLSPTLHSSVHLLRRQALAKASFTTIRQLSAAGKGLSSWCNRRLVFGTILPILTYGCDLFVPDTPTLKRLNSFWHAVLRWTTNCFYTTALGALYREASLSPISSICKHRRQSAAIRLLCAPSEFNHATTRIPESVPTWDQGRSVDYHRFLLQGSSKAVHLTSWLGPAVNSTKHLPLDSLSHEVSDLVEEIPILPLASTDLVALLLSRISSVTYQARRASRLRSLLTNRLDLSPPVPLFILIVPASLPKPLLASLDLYVAAFTTCVQVLAILPHMSPGGAGTPAPSARSVRKTMSPSSTRFSSALIRLSLASPISQVWMTLALTGPSGSRFPSSGG